MISCNLLGAVMKIFVTGDTHGNIDISKLSTESWPEQKGLTRDDILIIAGDFGGVWHDGTNGSVDQDDDLLKWHEDKPYTTIFLDGNHDNHPFIATFPEVEFLGACCNQIRPHVYHIKRGEVLHAGRHRIWCMGGAQSPDRVYRKAGINWWPEEIPSDDEWKHAFETLESENPDILITHEVNYTAACRIFWHSYGNTKRNTVSARLDEALNRALYKKLPISDWYFGHRHEDVDLDIDGIHYHALYQRVIELEA